MAVNVEQCPNCQSYDIWDNRADKVAGARSPKSPDFKCKACRRGFWLPPPARATFISPPDDGSPKACPGCGEYPAWHKIVTGTGRPHWLPPLDPRNRMVIERYLVRHRENMRCGRFNGAHTFVDSNDTDTDGLATGIGLG